MGRRAAMTLVISAALLALASALASIVACAPSRPAYGRPDGATETSTADAADAVVDAAPPYPDPPYGLTRGATFPNLSFQGYRGGSAEWVELRVSDYYDPDGSRGIAALAINVAAAWCPPCADEALTQPALWAQYEPRGARFLGVLAEGPRDAKPAVRADLDDWLAKYALPFDTAIPIVESDIVGKPKTFPETFFVDPRTMRVVAVLPGNDSAKFSIDVEYVLHANGSFADAGPDSADGAVTD